ncbi:hypothetical protein PaG_04763 [Moesziomyces aphidis]|uniref:t-SNARE coiled-coil homology domain-containing protein n=1 Tax=Moesziomyces aphidis TaxID=84754 RepID=W3VJ70_MOEAP|nr:hypothetical protein PaG_04763 [Moesziomyces aphidis]
MSFNDLERGSSSSRGGGAGGSGGSRKTPLPLYRDEVSNTLPPEFEKLTSKIGIQIFKINSNVTAIQKLITLSSSPSTSSAPSKAAGQDWSKRINDLIETTRELVKDVTTDIKQLSTFPLGSASGAAKLTQAKLQRDFQSAAMQFQRVQKDAVAKTRAKLEQDKQKERQMLRSRNSQLLIDTEEADRGAASSQQQQQAGADAGGLQAESLDLLPEGPSQADLEYQESLITSREAEIREIESGVQELNEIFRDLGNIVQEQGGMIDNIEFNINSIADNTAGADRELVVAHEYQRRAGRRCICLLLVVGFVVAIVLLAILN